VTDLLAPYRDAEFRWGEMDCCLFVANVLRDLCGRDYAEQWRGKYSTELGARRLVVKHGGLEGLASSVFGPMCPVDECGEGSPVLLNKKLIAQDSVGGALGIIHGGRVIYLTQRGLADAPMSYAMGGWRV
jgi:hypothetical protein